LNALGISAPYFETSQDSTTVNLTNEETRSAELSEVLHVCGVAHLQWERFWQANGAYRNLKEYGATSIFFDRLLFTPRNEMVTAGQ